MSQIEPEDRKKMKNAEEMREGLRGLDFMNGSEISIAVLCDTYGRMAKISLLIYGRFNSSWRVPCPFAALVVRFSSEEFLMSRSNLSRLQRPSSLFPLNYCMRVLFEVIATSNLKSPI